MDVKINNVAKNRPVVTFYLLAFVISWLGWVPQMLHHRGYFPFDHPLLSFLGGAGPTLAAVILVFIDREQDVPEELFKPLLRWRVPWGSVLVVISFWFLVSTMALSLGALFGIPLPSLSRFPGLSLFPIFIAMLFSNVWEEIGWRGFALPRLQQKMGDLGLSLVMGVLWSLWHLPFMLDPSSALAELPWLGELVFSLALSVIYTWLYNSTRRSLLYVTLFHAFSNTAAFALLELGVLESSYPYVVGLSTLLAVAIVVLYGPKSFSRDVRRE